MHVLYSKDILLLNNFSIFIEVYLTFRGIIYYPWYININIYKTVILSQDAHKNSRGVVKMTLGAHLLGG